MILIRTLTERDMLQAMELNVRCWTEELAGHCENTLSANDELAIWVDWMLSAKENNDIRLLIGAFEQDQMLGVAFASLAEVGLFHHGGSNSMACGCILTTGVGASRCG